MTRLLEESPIRFADRLRHAGLSGTRAVRDREGGAWQAPDAVGRELAAILASDERDCRSHEAVFLAIGPESGALFGAFVHATARGQAQGGVRRWRYEDLGDFLRDGLRLSLGMTRKNALAGLWWGGGKGLIDAGTGDLAHGSQGRATLFREYGAFVSSLRGCYVTGEDVGTTPADMEEVFRQTRFATCIPPECGGSGNPSRMTATGVVRAMEAAFESEALGGLAGRTVAVQGAGNVGSALVSLLLDAGVSRIIVGEISPDRRAALLDAHGDDRLEVHTARSGVDAILSEPCDVLAPCALGGVLGPKTIPGIRARIVCGGANNVLEDDDRDGRALAERGIVYVPDFVANRMGIVSCANEQDGHLSNDPAIERHLSRDWEGGVFQTTLRVLALARRDGIPPVAAANRLADELAREPHPLRGDRASRIVASFLPKG